MKIDIDKLNEAELIDLNNRVVARLKFLSQMRAHAHMLDFSIGENGQQWRVAPVFLRRTIVQDAVAETRNLEAQRKS